MSGDRTPVPAPPPALLHPFARPSAGAEAYVRIVRGHGARVWDDLGNRYVDALASLWYCNAGHGRREIADAVARQLGRLDAFHTFDRFTNEPADLLAERLASMAPMPSPRVFLTSSGSEAVDSAIKLARVAHFLAGDDERTVVVSRAPSYHGVSYGALSATGLPDNRRGFGPLVGDVVQVPYDSVDALDRALDEHAGRVAAVIAEPVVGAGGVLPPPDGYFAALRDRCDRAGAFLIVDEVICGFGRLGRWWGSQRYGVRPDLVTFAKGVTSGYLPLGGVLVGGAVRERLEADNSFLLRHGHTYSGHPAACAAALANLDVLEREDLPARAVRVGERLESLLRSMVDDKSVVEVRGDGAMWAVGLGEGISAGDVRDEMLDRGVIARPLGASAIAFCPPLVIDGDDLEHCASALAESLDAVPRA